MKPRRPIRLVAHTPPKGTERWHYLDDHLAAVAETARAFAGEFAAGDLAFLAGVWHDLGKCNPAFQDYLWACFEAQRQNQRPPRSKKTPHAIWGGAYAYQLLKNRAVERWPDLALPLQGHHTRLSDAGTGELILRDFVESKPDAIALMHKLVKTIVAKQKDGLPSPRFRSISKLDQDFFVRMLFSTLVDADRLNTEEHTNPKSSLVRSNWPSVESLWTILEAYQANHRDDSTPLNRLRLDVYDTCLKAAERPPGLFRLTVPTGGGKTRSGLAFALKHAVEHKLRRVVVALPYTSIIDQNAKVYRDILGEGSLLEHHSAIEVPDQEDEDDIALRLRLASENWDATLIVTTTVQLFESLFGNTASKVRKLHRLARSVIILDEVQALPPELLLPTVDGIRLLATPVDEGGYGATVVLCTATQPTFEVGPLAELIPESEVHEIVPTYPRLFGQLKRVRYDWRHRPLTWADLAEELREQPRALAVLNTRMDALAVLDAMADEENVFHLSTLLCGAHRRAVLARVKELVEQRRSVRLISTQVIECGVDLSFPVVYRAVGPLDRVVQVAGRCNRNFEQAEGEVVVFEAAEGSAPRGPYAAGIEKAHLLMRDETSDALHDPELYCTYFRRLFDDLPLDAYDIQDKRQALNFPEVAREYRLIRQPTIPVVVPFGIEWKWRLDDWSFRPSRRSWQRLQPYIVNLYEYEASHFRPWLIEVSTGLYQWTGDYDSERHRGIVAPLSDPSDLLVTRFIV